MAATVLQQAIAFAVPRSNIAAGRLCTPESQKPRRQGHFGPSTGSHLAGLERRISGDPERLLDRVFIPGVSFKIGREGAATPNLQKLQKLAAVCTCCPSRTSLLGDPPKRV
jgi:hypothetical protein